LQEDARITTEAQRQASDDQKSPALTPQQRPQLESSKSRPESKELAPDEIVRLQAKYKELRKKRPKPKQPEIMDALRQDLGRFISDSSIYRHIIQPLD
jgi:hypothetical protein